MNFGKIIRECSECGDMSVKKIISIVVITFVHTSVPSEYAFLDAEENENQ